MGASQQRKNLRKVLKKRIVVFHAKWINLIKILYIESTGKDIMNENTVFFIAYSHSSLIIVWILENHFRIKSFNVYLIIKVQNSLMLNLFEIPASSCPSSAVFLSIVI